MKKHLFLFLLIGMLLPIIQSMAQSCNYTENFELGIDSNHLWLDTVQINNIWQVGHPQKNIFTSGYFSLRAIATDTINVYPINNTSSFYIREDYAWFCGGYKVIAFQYQTNTDTLKDYGFIEYSVNGGNWYNLTDTLYKLGLLNSPVFSGTTTGWQSFISNMSITFNIWYPDSILFKFTFVSDSIQDNKDGWIIDDINVMHVSSVPEINLLPINSYPFPNPAVDVVTIEIKETNVLPLELTIMDYLGRKIYKEKNINKQRIEIETKNFNQGIYFYKLTNSETNQSGNGKFIVTKE